MLFRDRSGEKLDPDAIGNFGDVGKIGNSPGN